MDKESSMGLSIDTAGRGEYLKDRGNDIRKTDLRESRHGQFFRIRHIRGSIQDHFVGIVLGIGSFFEWITKPIRNVLKILDPDFLENTIENIIKANKRADIFTNFQDFSKLAENGKNLDGLCQLADKFADEAKICASTSWESALPGVSGTDIKRSRGIIESGSVDAGENRAVIGAGGKNRSENVNTHFISSNDVFEGEDNSYNLKVNSESDEIFKKFPENLRKNCQEHDGVFVDPNTGLVATFMLDKRNIEENEKSKIHIIFPGTGQGSHHSGSIGWEHVANDVTTLGVVTSHVPPSYSQARDLVGLMKRRFGKDYQIEVKGFSMGGGLAAFAGIDNEVKTTTLCSTPLSPECQRQLGDEKMKRMVKNKMITNLTVKNCWVSDHRTAISFGNTLERGTGRRVPRMVGEVYRVGKSPGRKKYGYNLLNAHNNSDHIWKNFSSRLNKKNQVAKKAEL
jgi:hypothetical protein